MGLHSSFFEDERTNGMALCGDDPFLTLLCYVWLIQSPCGGWNHSDVQKT